MNIDDRHEAKFVVHMSEPATVQPPFEPLRAYGLLAVLHKCIVTVRTACSQQYQEWVWDLARQTEFGVVPPVRP